MARVLIVVDDVDALEVMVEIVVEIVEAQGHAVDTAASTSRRRPTSDAAALRTSAEGP